MGQEVSAEALVNLPIAQSWEKLKDFSAAHNYVPGIIRTEIISEQSQGVGASRYVYQSSKRYIQETVEQWEEGRGFLIRLHKGDKPAPPFKNAFFRYQLDSQGPDQTLLSVNMNYQLPWGVLGTLLSKVLANTVRSNISDVALALKLYYESGEPTTPAALKAYKQSSK
jgi:carbon monoxide dehydrogenase subunit G